MTAGYLESSISEPIKVGPWPLSSYVDAVRTYQFDWAAPSGSEDALVNNLKPGDLVYESAPGKIKKLQVQTTNAVAKGAIVGIVARISSGIDWNIYGEYDFTSANDGNAALITVYKEIAFFNRVAKIHNNNAAGADTRDAFNFTTHATAGAVLTDVVKPDGMHGVDAVSRFV